MRIKQHLSHAVVASLFIFSTGASPLAHAQSAQEIAEIKSLMNQVGNPGDARAASTALLQLKDHPYAEVEEFALKILEAQLGGKFGTPNSFFIGNAIQVLVETASSQNLARLQQIQATSYAAFQRANVGKGFLSYIDANFNQAIANATYRQPLPNAFPAPVAAPVAPVARPSNPSTSTTTRNAALQQRLDSYKSLTEMLQAAGPMTPESVVLNISTIINDEIADELKKGEEFTIIGREKEAAEVIDTLVRMKGRNPFLIGPRGAGKSTIAEKVAFQIIAGQLPAHAVYQETLGNAYFVETSAGRIARLAKSNEDSAQGAAIEQYFEAILETEKKLGIKIVVFIDEFHTLPKGMIEAAKPYLESKRRGISLIGASTAGEFQAAFKDNPAIIRRIHQIGVAEQPIPEVIEIITKAWAPMIEKKYGVNIDAQAIEAVVENAHRTYPDTSRTDGSAKMIQDIAISMIRENASASQYDMNEERVFKFIQDRLGYPVNPFDARAMISYEEDLKRELRTEVIEQDRMIDDVVDLWLETQRDMSKGLRVAMAIGPTGTGKSHLGRRLAKRIFNNEGAFLEVDANRFKTGSLSLNTFFGAPNGVISSDKTSGEFFEYLDDPGRGKNGGIILINEGERAHADFWEAMMEVMDTGRAVGGDGKERFLRRHIIIITSNRGDKIIYPSAIERWSIDELKNHMRDWTPERLQQLFTESISGNDEYRLPDPILKRIDKFTLAAPIIRPVAEKIGIQKAAAVELQLERDYKINLTIKPEVIRHLVNSSYQVGGGTRPVEKAILETLSKAVRRGITDLDVARGGSLELDLGTRNGNQVNLAVTSGAKAVELPLQEEKSMDPLQDKEFVQRLQNLERVMNEVVFGQPEATSAIVKAVRSHQSTKLVNARPLVFGLIGSTGTGKTETAKGLALGLYGSKDRAVVIPFGNVQFEGDLNLIFNSPRGYAGSNQVGLFEQALINNPNGGVLVFDELSNVGGNNKAEKEKLLKKYFYDMFDEGKFTSTVTNKTYELGKYTIIITGNDGEKLFFGMSSDDMRMATWEANREKEKVTRLLRENGVPEALVGRMVDVVLQRPATKESTRMIARKLLGEVLAPYEKIGVKFRFDEAFVNALAEKFYTHSKGGRSLRNVIETQVKAGVAEAAIDAGGWDGMKGKTVSFSIDDNRVERTWAKTIDPRRVVTVNTFLEDGAGQKTQVAKIVATEHATNFIRQTGPMVLATAYHEAGHAVANLSRITGRKVAFITIRGQDGYLGYARYEEVLEGVHKNMTEQVLIAEVASALAGQMAQKMAGYGEDVGWAQDIKQARTMITRFLSEGGMAGMANVPVDKDGNVRLTGKRLEQYNQEFERIWAEAAKQADSTLKSNWELVRQVAGELVGKGEITSIRYSEMDRNLRVRGNPTTEAYRPNRAGTRMVRTPENPAHPSNPSFGTVPRMCKQVFTGGR